MFFGVITHDYTGHHGGSIAHIVAPYELQEFMAWHRKKPKDEKMIKQWQKEKPAVQQIPTKRDDRDLDRLHFPHLVGPDDFEPIRVWALFAYNELDKSAVLLAGLSEEHHLVHHRPPLYSLDIPAAPHGHSVMPTNILSGGVIWPLTGAYMLLHSLTTPFSFLLQNLT